MVASRAIREAYRRLLRHYGPQGWWPGRDELEVCLGAILTQATAWRNVERALANLERGGALTYGRVVRISERRLAALLRPAGYFNQKARKLRAFLRFLGERCGGDARRLAGEDPAELRAALLAVKGIGPETADSILCYAGRHPVFVVDAYTRRVLVRHAWAGAGDGYDRLQAILASALERRESVANEAHALFVAVGKDRCRKGAPLCGGCPIEGLLPAGGPLPLQ